MVQTEKEKKNNNPIKNLEDLCKIYSQNENTELIGKISLAKQELSNFVGEIKRQIKNRENEIHLKEKEVEKPIKTEPIKVEEKIVKVEEKPVESKPKETIMVKTENKVEQKVEKVEPKTEKPAEKTEQKVTKTETTSEKPVQPKVAPKPSTPKFEFNPVRNEYRNNNRNDNRNGNYNNNYNNNGYNNYNNNSNNNYNNNGNNGNYNSNRQDNRNSVRNDNRNNSNGRYENNNSNGNRYDNNANGNRYENNNNGNRYDNNRNDNRTNNNTTNNNGQYNANRFENRTNNYRDNRNNGDNRNRDTQDRVNNRNYNANNNGASNNNNSNANRFQRDDSRNFSRDRQQNRTDGRTDNRNYQPRTNEQRTTDNRQNVNRTNPRDNQFNKDRKFDPTKKPIFNKKPFESKPAPVEKIIVKESERQFGNKKKTHQTSQDKKEMSIRQKVRMGIIDNQNDEEEKVYRRTRNKKKEEQKENNTVIKAEITHAVITTDNLTVKILSEAIGKPAAEIIKKLFTLGNLCNINSSIDFDTAELIASDMNITIEKKLAETFEDKLNIEVEKEKDVDDKFMQKRPPIVTVMGHVDHGKTSLLDAIRKTHVIDKEAGGITQHIGAYSVKTSKGDQITFLDTPGHEAFTAMRERGAQVTDIAILIVAADDGVMPQTKESIRIINEAKIPMVVAINKIDKPGANIPRLMSQLADNGVMLEEWGGDVMSAKISAKKGENIDELLEAVILVAEVLELKANPNAKASGIVIESKLDKGLGPVATVIITNGTLKVGDSVASGTACGRIRALIDENGKKIKKALPSTPVSILGLDAVPNAGDKMNVIDEKMLKQLVNERKNKKKEELITSKKVTKDNLFSTDKRTKTLSIIVKADVQGSAQAIKDAIEKIENEEVKINVLSAEVGAVTENDLMHATTAQNVMIICFNQKVNPKAKALADREKIEIKDYSIIYELIDDVTEKAKSMMDPKYKEVPIGKAEVRAVFNLSSSGIIAGSYVLEGKIQRNAKCRVYRKNKLVCETDIIGLKNKKEDVKEIGVQFECGIKLNNFNEVQVGDIVEAYILERIN